MAGHDDLFNLGAFPVLQYVLKGVRCAPRPPEWPHLPTISTNHTKRLKILCHTKSQWTFHGGETDYVMLWAACCVGYFWFHEGRRSLHPGQESNPLPSQSRPLLWMTKKTHHGTHTPQAQQDRPIPAWSGHLFGSYGYRLVPSWSITGLHGSSSSSKWAPLCVR